MIHNGQTKMTTRLYVGNLSRDTTSDALREAFGRFGEVVDVHVLIDRYSGRPRGFAFVTMASPEQAAHAVSQMNGATFEGRSLRVHEAETRGGQAASGTDGSPRNR